MSELALLLLLLLINTFRVFLSSLAFVWGGVAQVLPP